jgi:Acyl-CoA synthetases (AMP-forming)/AMP-acid ligases II
MAQLAGLFEKWQSPDDVIVMDALPHTATGKLSKQTIRRELEAKGYRAPGV